MLALECIGLTSFDLQIQISRQVGNLLLDGTQSYQTVKFCQTVRDIHRLGSLVWNILHFDGHQFLVAHLGNALSLQTLSLLLTDLVEESTHGTTVGEVLVTELYISVIIFLVSSSASAEKMYFLSLAKTSMIWYN